MNTTNVDYKDLRRQMDARYFVQWVTKFDSIQGRLQVVGSCVRNRKTGETLFYHESADVCEKVCEMLNEGDNKC